MAILFQIFLKWVQNGQFSIQRIKKYSFELSDENRRNSLMNQKSLII